MKTKIKEALQFFGPMNPIETLEKFRMIGLDRVSLDYLANEMFLMATNKEIRFSDLPFSLPENRYYKI